MRPPGTTPWAPRGKRASDTTKRQWAVTANGWSTPTSRCSCAIHATTRRTFTGNEDEKEFGLHNYLGLAVHDPDGKVHGHALRARRRREELRRRRTRWTEAQLLNIVRTPSRSRTGIQPWAEARRPGLLYEKRTAPTAITRNTPGPRQPAVARERARYRSTMACSAASCPDGRPAEGFA